MALHEADLELPSEAVCDSAKSCHRKVAVSVFKAAKIARLHSAPFGKLLLGQALGKPSGSNLAHNLPTNRPGIPLFFEGRIPPIDRFKCSLKSPTTRPPIIAHAFSPIGFPTRGLPRLLHETMRQNHALSHNKKVENPRIIISLSNAQLKDTVAKDP